MEEWEEIIEYRFIQRPSIGFNNIKLISLSSPTTVRNYNSAGFTEKSLNLLPNHSQRTVR